MVTNITQGIQISVETFFQEEQSNPIMGEFTFAYRIRINNLNKFSVKLLSRQWSIFDSNGQYRIVEGEGVVGVQPILNENEFFEYVSGCNLRSEIGRMEGFYIFQNLSDMENIKVKIPSFELFAPSKLN